MRSFGLLLLALAFWLPLGPGSWEMGGAAQAGEVIPPTPNRYLNDYANLLSSATAEDLSRELTEFEKSTSSQVVVAIFPRMQSDSSIEDYANRVFRAWQVGQKQRNNGVVLFIFVEERRMRIEVGYGLEGALPDVIAKRIIEDEIKPLFQRNQFDAGVAAGVHAILQATRGEYKPSGGSGAGKGGGVGVLMVFMVIVFLIMVAMRRGFRRGATVYTRSGGHSWGGWGSGGWGAGGSGWGGGGWSGGGGWGGGGGFSGGGGSSGGGGASGGW